MITHIIDSYQISSQNKTKSKLQILKNAKNSYFVNLQKTLHMTRLLKFLNKKCKYEMDPENIVEVTDRRMDWQTDARYETSIPPFQLRWSRGYNELTYHVAGPQIISYNTSSFKELWPRFIAVGPWGIIRGLKTRKIDPSQTEWL